MRYQERIYIQNDNRVLRNKDILNVNMSSDICIFKSPSFDVSGATKIQCGPIVCELSGVSSENILNTAIFNCFTSNSMSGECFSSVTWSTRIYEDGNLTYSGDYYTSYLLTGDTPSNTLFFNSLILGLTNLNYAYTLNETTLTIEKKYGGAKELQYNLCLIWGIKPNIFVCPVGFTATSSNDACQKITTSAATNNGSGSPIAASTPNNAWGNYGTRFYPSIQTGVTLPVVYTGNNGNLISASNQVITANAIVSAGNTFWENSASSPSNGRLNNVGLSAPSSQFVGFSKCINITEAGTYYVGVAADNRCKVSVDGIEYISFTGTVQDNFKIWSVFPFEFSSGKHIIEMVGQDDGAGGTGFGAEIYYPTGATPFATLTAATSTASTQSNAIFSTSQYVGQNWLIGTTVGYSCTVGYTPDFCDPLNPVCTKIENAAISGVSCTGICGTVCTELCSDTFPYIDNTSQGVYLLDSSISTVTIPFKFNFTANTQAFTANNATFNYKIYRYMPETGVFKLPAVYETKNINYTQISGLTSTTFTQSIPVSGLSIDGDYLIKGFFEANACTDFLNRLGKKIDTTVNNQGSVNQVYEPTLDYYFVALRKADTPYFNYNTENLDLVPTGGISLYQQVIIVDDTLVPPYPGIPVSVYPADPTVTLGPPYFRTGSTFALLTEYSGDVVITLNGLTLTKNLDYTLTGQTLTVLGPVTNGDIITIIYTRTANRPIIGEPIYVSSTIPSGTTNNQGSSKYYYNTSTQKYEIYINNTPFTASKIIVILNGITLVNDVDYYQSTTNSKRIILNGTIMVGDILTVIYYPTASLINGITTTNNYVSWYIENPPQSVNGTFYLEYSSDSGFSTYTTSDTILYVKDLTNYTGILTLTGSVGTNLYYRVKNVKDYVSICGDVISSTAYSETVKVQIQSNGINSY